MAVTVNFTDQALSDIEEIAIYISHNSSHYAALQVAKNIRKGRNAATISVFGQGCS